MSKHFERDMQSIEHQLLSLFGVVEKMIDDAARGLCDNRVELVRQVIETDEQVNQAEVAIETECLKTLALHQPVATDMRRITTVLKIISDLERIADLACNIAERTQCLNQHPYFPIPDRLPDMVRHATKMVRMALDSFVDQNAEMAHEVIRLDSVVDEHNLAVIHELREIMKRNSDSVEPALHCFSASRHVERIADHAENIAEDVVYMVDGTIIRHHHDKVLDSSGQQV